MPLVNADLTTTPDDRGYSCVVWFSIEVSKTLFGLDLQPDEYEAVIIG
jgi:hypothetical protein